jgi:hypothetical protein
MSITLELTKDEEARLRRAAVAAGKEINAYIRQQLFLPDTNTAQENTSPIVDDLEFLQSAASATVQEAQLKLLAQGIDYIYRDSTGAIVRHFTDGTNQILTSADTK